MLRVVERSTCRPVSSAGAGTFWPVNAAANDIFAFSRLAEADHNSLLSVLTNPATRRRFAPHGRTRPGAWSRSFERPMTSGPAIQPSATCCRGCGRALRSLRAGGRRHDVSGVTAGRKSLTHPKEGRLKLEYLSCQANDDPALEFIIYTKRSPDPLAVMLHLPAGSGELCRQHLVFIRLLFRARTKA